MRYLILFILVISIVNAQIIQDNNYKVEVIYDNVKVIEDSKYKVGISLEPLVGITEDSNYKTFFGFWYPESKYVITEEAPETTTSAGPSPAGTPQDDHKVPLPPKKELSPQETRIRQLSSALASLMLISIFIIAWERRKRKQLKRKIKQTEEEKWTKKPEPPSTLS